MGNRVREQIVRSHPKETVFVYSKEQPIIRALYSNIKPSRGLLIVLYEYIKENTRIAEDLGDTETPVGFDRFLDTEDIFYTKFCDMFEPIGKVAINKYLNWTKCFRINKREAMTLLNKAEEMGLIQRSKTSGFGVKEYRMIKGAKNG